MNNARVKKGLEGTVVLQFVDILSCFLGPLFRF